MRRPLRSLLTDDEGMTLVELSIGVGLLVMVMAMLFTVMQSTQTNLERQVSRSTTNDEIRLAVESLDREVRSGDVLYDPSVENYAPGDIAPYQSIRVYTESNANTNGGARCIQWRITTGGELQRRWWTPDWQGSPSTRVSDWRIVATHIVNRTDGTHAFERPAPTTDNLIVVTFHANEDPTARKGSVVEVKQSISGRNTLYGSNQLCGPIPPNPSTPAANPVPAY